ncbi:MAG: signal peptidase I [Prevotella sp.]|nr:signal peptidase I [Bacteroides sp.]MCM1366656.1 signal peptidase I [Prevotella sp.]MCM1437323.1 signal peptidase I [Prevotella sp.]
MNDNNKSHGKTVSQNSNPSPHIYQGRPPFTPATEPKKLSFGEDFARRLKETKTSRWIRFGCVSLVFFLWVFWMGNPWLSFIWLLLFDIYITGYIPFTWWKKSKNAATRSVMAWVDAIVYALVLVYFIFAFIGQNYQIPSSSLEKSLLVGDYLWVNKTVYGPRVPQTPIHFPLAQHTLPIVNTKSYLEKPQLNYHRLKGLRSIERGDIVVFNFPQGDTVALKIQNPDYYQIVYELTSRGIKDARGYIKQHPEEFGEVIWRPVDRRENYVKRAIGLPGERIKIKNDKIFINGKEIAEPTEVQFNYIIPVTSAIPTEMWQEIGVRMDDHGTSPVRNDYTGELFYDVPLTKEAKEIVEKWPQVKGKLISERESGYFDLGGVFPLGNSYGWTRPDMGEFWIPKRGSTLHLSIANLPIYRRCIETYEGNKLEIKDGKIYINDKETEYYTFKMDYYWMMGDNRDRSLDSRYWGFVPEDHIVGSPVFVLISFDEEKSLSNGKIRWERIFRDANPDKSASMWQ